MSALALQKAIRARLTGSPAVVALVPAANIVDTHGKPARFPSVIMGEDQEVDAEITLERRHIRVYVTLHLWDQASSTTSTKAIGDAVRKALHNVDVVLDRGRLLDLKHAGTRYLHDPDGITTHGVMTLEALIEERRS